MILRDVAVVFSKLLSIILLRGTRESHEEDQISARNAGLGVQV